MMIKMLMIMMMITKKMMLMVVMMKMVVMMIMMLKLTPELQMKINNIEEEDFNCVLVFFCVQPERLQTPEPHRRGYRDNDRPRRSPSPRYRRSRSPRRYVLSFRYFIVL